MQPSADMQTQPSEPEDDIAAIDSLDRMRTLVRIYRLLAAKRLEHIGMLEAQVARLRVTR